MPGSDFLEPEDEGAFVVVTTWARDSQEYKAKVEEAMNSYGLFVAGVEDSAPFASRTEREFDDEVVDLISRISSNPDAVLYGTFQTYSADN
jgi:hypothetical protein